MKTKPAKPNLYLILKFLVYSEFISISISLSIYLSPSTLFMEFSMECVYELADVFPPLVNQAKSFIKGTILLFSWKFKNTFICLILNTIRYTYYYSGKLLETSDEYNWIVSVTICFRHNMSSCFYNLWGWLIPWRCDDENAVSGEGGGHLIPFNAWKDPSPWHVTSSSFMSLAVNVFRSVTPYQGRTCGKLSIRYSSFFFNYFNHRTLLSGNNRPLILTDQ